MSGLPPSPKERRRAWTRRRIARRLLYVYVPMAVMAAVLSLLLTFTVYLPGETEVLGALQTLDWVFLLPLMVGVSALGYAPLAYLVPALLAIGLAWRRRWQEMAFLALAVASDPFVRLIKVLVGRERPSPDLYAVYQIVHEPSFPSGHVVYYTTFYGFLIYLLLTHWPPSPRRTAALALPATLIVLVGFSRLYLGAHFPADVVGGYLIGGLWLAGVCELYRWRRRAEPPSPGR